MRNLGDITKINGAEIPVVDVICGGSYCVYKYVFPDGYTYIGVTGGTVQNRRNCGYQHNKKLRNLVDEYTWKKVETIILEQGLTENDAFEKEKEYIAIEKGINPEKNVNVSLGGKSTFLGLKHTEAYKKHMSDLYKGKQFSNETINKMCESHAKERKPVKKCDDEMNMICVYDSLGDAALDVIGYKSNISRACVSGKKYKGYFWSFVERG